MTSNDRFRELLLQHGDYLDRIEEAWRLADSTMVEFQVAGMKRHTGGHEKIAADERASARRLIADYHDEVVMPLLPLVDEMLQRELMVFADRLHQDIQDPRRPWSTRYRERQSRLDRLLYARSAKAERQARLTLDDLSDGSPAQQVQVQAPEGEWSKPMPKKVLMNRLDLNPRAFKTFTKQHPLREISRQQWQIRLDTMDSRTRERIETGK